MSGNGQGTKDRQQPEPPILADLETGTEPVPPTGSHEASTPKPAPKRKHTVVEPLGTSTVGSTN
ncbi:hypothetical protein F0L68_14365 [Solihabitans fulvus]|uniref:Uncharacterized protein n=1 Tax=Solihabitans fulvus TaxID=1892852 RepID=A0A5B2XHY6_9PSEU|nr:hypothetical protein [Solihabitans fulvus]KAA2262440.1 hypothetical protein F0L68_14365 [Solihabitans fulvus]